MLLLTALPPYLGQLWKLIITYINKNFGHNHKVMAKIVAFDDTRIETWNEWME